MAPPKRKVLGDFYIGKTIGQGAFSKVKIGYHKETGLKVAVKVINKRMLAQKVEKAKKRKKGEKENENGTNTTKGFAVPSYMQSVQLEVQLMMRLDHPNVIKLYQMMENEEEVYIIMEYATGGELINYIANKGHLSEKEARKFFRQMISALDHCHMANVVHRDLKLENLLLDSNRDLLISDFGLGRTFRDDELLKTFCGTPNYAAAELVSGIPYKGEKSDIWAMGVVLYIMMTGSPPFRADTISALYGKIKDADYNCPSYFSDELVSLLGKILVTDPEQRASMEDIRSDAWVNMGESQLPTRLPPKVQGDIQPDAIGKVVSAITQTENMTIYTFRALTIVNPVPKEQVSGSSHSRRSSINQQSTVIEKLSSLPARVRMFSSPTPGFTPTSPVSPISEVTYGPRRMSRLFSVSTQRQRPSISEKPPALDLVSSGSGDHGPQPLVTSATVGATGNRSRPSISRSPVAGYRAELTIPTPEASPTKLSTRSHSVQQAHNHSKSPFSENRILAARSKSHNKSLDDPDPFFHSKSSEEEDLIPYEDEVGGQLPMVTEDDIVEWHNIHKPPKEIRTIRWNFSTNTTSSLPPSIIFQHVHKALDDLNEQHYGSLKYKRVEEYYMFQCTYNIPNQDEKIEFEVEVCRVWLLKVYGVKVKRSRGDPIMFKEIFSHFVGLLNF